MDMPESLEYVLGRIEGKLDAVILRQQEHDSQLEQHNQRISGLEKWKAGVVAVAAAVSAIIASVVRLIH